MDLNKQVTIIVLSFILVGSLAGGVMLITVMDGSPVPTDDTVDTVDNTTAGPEVTNTDIDDTRTFSSEAETAINSTVTLYTETGEELESQGSGFFFKEDYIMTNAHVVLNTSLTDTSPGEIDTIYIKYSDGSWAEAKVVGIDRYSDIAVLKPTKKPSFVEPLELSESVPVRGQSVIAIGTPLGYTNTVTEGIISGTERSMSFRSGGFTIPDTLQTDASIEPGNSGGPLVLKGSEKTVVGVNRAKEGTSIGFAVSSRLAKMVGEDLIQHGEFKHNYVGFSGRELTPIEDGYEDISVNNGIVVLDVMEGSPSEGSLTPKSGENIEDVIVGVDDQEVSDLEEFSTYLTLNKSPGDEVTLTINNDGEVREETIVLAERPKYGSVNVNEEE